MSTLEKKELSNDSDQMFALVGMRSSSENSDSEGELSLEIISAFSDVEKAVMARDIYSGIDTTMSFLSVIPCKIRDDVPNINLMLHIFTNEEGDITVETHCSFNEEEPWLKVNEDKFDAFAWPEDEDVITQSAIEWSENKFGKNAHINRIISPQANEIIKR